MIGPPVYNPGEPDRRVEHLRIRGHRRRVVRTFGGRLAALLGIGL